MRKNLVKKAMAVVAMAAAVVTAVPAGQAEAACSHRYNTTCLGYKWSTPFHHTYTWEEKVFFIPYTRSVECDANVVYHGDRTQCVDCGALNGTGEHYGAVIHQDCPCTEYSCSGSGTVVGGFY